MAGSFKNDLDGLTADTLLSFKRNVRNKSIFDGVMHRLDFLGRFHSVECHVSLLPYSRSAKHSNVNFFPFEDEVREISGHMRSVYTEIKSPMPVIFGLFLALVIVSIFEYFLPETLLSVEAVVSVIGAYAVGKEIWDDIDNGLTRLTKNSRIRYTKSYYVYQLEAGTTMTRYSSLAKRIRYGMGAVLPERFDFINQSNNQTLRMLFSKGDLVKAEGAKVHIFSCHVDEAVLPEFVGQGFMFGLKISANRRGLFFNRSVEVFQSVTAVPDKNGQLTLESGSLPDDGDWQAGSIFYRHTASLGRIKLFLRSGMIQPAGKILEVDIA